MVDKIPRLRMFAGPNGSGKSSLKAVLSPQLIGRYLNADEVQIALASSSGLDLLAFGLPGVGSELFTFLADSLFLSRVDLAAIDLKGNVLRANFGLATAYVASAIADFVRRKYLDRGISFSFETVMSHPDKVEVLTRAREADISLLHCDGISGD